LQTANPVLLEGEPATESDTLKQKIGDGVTAYNSLDYLNDNGSPGLGTVTSVALALPNSIFTVSGSPVIASGTLAATLASQAAGRVFAGPASGADVAPTFRQLGYGELSGRPTLGTAAAAATTDFATAAQGLLAASAIQPGDAALSDSREWTASTVDQAEAEAGTATTRRAWTAQRVFQAIAAWWAASAASTKLAGIATGATANATNAELRDRATHTGTQAVGTITGLATVATSGAYGDLSGRPTLGTAAATASADYATAAQGARADAAFQVVNHGSTAGTARPAGAPAVYWIGTVEPTNALDGDLWIGGA
jgi:hypothetical protein